jgi:hypothetical protein
MPTIDLSFWRLPDGSPRREGSCHYIGKLTGIHKFSPEGISNESIEIRRDINMTREDIKRIFQTSEKFYCYEDSALAIEAALCGCETIFIQNKFFSGVPLASKELDFEDKYSTSSHSQIPYDALKYATTLKDSLRKKIHVIPEVVAEFAAKWRKMAGSVPYKGTISYPFKPMMIFIDKGIELDVEPAPFTEVNVEPAPVTEVNVEPAPFTEVNVEPAPVTEVNVEPAPVTEVNVEPDPVIETIKLTRRSKLKRKAKSAIKHLLTRLKAY